MDKLVNGKRAHAATGGTHPLHDAPAIVLLHGAGMDRTVWQFQTRYLSHRGIRTLAVDLPGHGESDGPALHSISGMADWVVAFMDVAEVAQAALVGHSMGALIALEVAARAPARVRALGLLGAAADMPVHPDLIAAAEGAGPLAAELITDWGFGAVSHKGGHPHPGFWAMGGAARLLQGAAPGVLAGDLRACDTYKGALEAAARVTAPVLLICGDEDKMTPPKNARGLVEAADNITQIVLPATGHMMMIERPREVAKLLLEMAE